MRRIKSERKAHELFYTWLANESIKKRQKLQNDNQICPSTTLDRISNLPTPILCHILSFLSTKQAVGISILGRRWRFLWTEVHNLEFDRRHVNEADSDDEGRYPDHPKDPDKRISFADVVYRVLLLNKAQSINTFRISDEGWGRKAFNKHQFESWIRTVVVRNVQVIDIRVGISMPPCLFNSKTLVSLKLSQSINICISLPVCLPNVKKLQLLDVYFENSESLPILVSGCSVLEELTVQRSSLDRMYHCNISSATIVFLTLNFLCKAHEGLDNYELHIDTPSLCHLHLRDRLSGHFSVGILSSLVEAYIHLWNNLDRDCVLGVVERVSRVRCLEFSTKLSLPLYSEGKLLPRVRFENLIKLDLETDRVLLNKFLEIADNLEILVIRKTAELKNWKDDYRARLSSKSCLRTVIVHGYHDETRLIRYFLSNALNLERMEIYSDLERTEQKFDAVQKITRHIPETCKFDFH